MSEKPRNRGSSVAPVSLAPETPGFRISTSTPVITSVVIPQIVALGMSRAGSIDSSAASGSSSIAR